jgi:hypothetical protein
MFTVSLETGVEIDVEACSFHPRQFEPSAGHDPIHGEYRWRINTPVLCYQGGFVAWQLKPAVALANQLSTNTRPLTEVKVSVEPLPRATEVKVLGDPHPLTDEKKRADSN